MATNIQVSGLPETTSIAATDYLHVKKTDGVDYKIKQSASAVIGIQDTAANLATSNPVLLAGQWSKETDTGLVKCGDGTTSYNGLVYLNDLIPDSTIKTTSFTAKSGYVYLVDTSSGSINVTLPTPTSGITRFKIIDTVGKFGVNNCILLYSSNRILGLTENLELDVPNITYECLWTKNTVYGWEVN